MMALKQFEKEQGLQMLVFPLLPSTVEFISGTRTLEKWFTLGSVLPIH
jgi:hypothetical protein